METSENKLNRENFETALLKAHPDLDISFNADTNTYQHKDVQLAWWAWQEQQKDVDELLENKKDYACDCGYLDNSEDEEEMQQQVDERVRQAIQDKVVGLINLANFHGLDELLDELDRIGFEVGKKLNRQLMLKSIPSKA